MIKQNDENSKSALNFKIKLIFTFVIQSILPENKADDVIKTGLRREMLKFIYYVPVYS
jgi:hypothetical protein